MRVWNYIETSGQNWQMFCLHGKPVDYEYEIVPEIRICNLKLK